MINKRVLSLFVSMIVSCMSFAQEIQPLSIDDMPSIQQVRAAMATANEYFMFKWPDPGEDIITDKTRPSNIWTRATYYEGLMALYDINPHQEYYDYAVTWGESHNWGMRSGNTTRNADDQCCGQTYIDLYIIDPQPGRIADIKTSIDGMVNSAKVDDWWWVDAIQMAMPIFAKLGALYNDNQYYEKMYELFNYSKMSQGANGLFNPDDGLWWRDKNFDPPYTTPNGKQCYWSRGNGWVFAALVRVLDIMPENTPHREEYLHMFKTMAAALVEVQRPDGFWNVSLHDPDDYGGKELSGTAFFVYGLAWGVNYGVLDPAIYKSSALRGWNGMVNDALHPNGALGYVQSTASKPSDGQPLSYDKMPNFEDYGLGAFLLAGSEIFKIARNGATWEKSYLVPPIDGDYTFWVVADAPAQLWFSSNALAANAEMIASIPDAAMPGHWTKYPQQQSISIPLKAGRKYYIEVKYDDTSGGDRYYAVAWQGPDMDRQQIEDNYLKFWDTAESLPGDFTGNNIVDFNDLLYFCNLWLQANCDLGLNVDLDSDCYIDLTDYSVLANSWLPEVAPTIITIRIQENEDGYVGVFGGSVDDNNAGFTGTGFVNTDNAVDQYIEWEVETLTDGYCEFKWRFANGSSGNRNASIYVNGEAIPENIDFVSTGSWTSWDTSSLISIMLSEGKNTIRLIAETSSGLANIDWIEITGPVAE